MISLSPLLLQKRHGDKKEEEEKIYGHMKVQVLKTNGHMKVQEEEKYIYIYCHVLMFFK
jgi:hypothetical protein